LNRLEEGNVTVGNNKTLSITFEVENGDSINGTFKGSLVMILDDLDSQREATITLSNVEVTVNNGTITSIKVLDNAQLTVEGTDSSGNPVEATFTNISADTVSGGNNNLTYNLENIETKVQDETGNTDALHQVIYAGNYEITIYSPDFPMDSVQAHVTVPE
jgi:hypothetical protein